MGPGSRNKEEQEGVRMELEGRESPAEVVDQVGICREEGPCRMIRVEKRGS